MARLPAIALLLLSLLLSARAFAETRLALVITNKDYPASVGALSNPHSDGERIARTLTRLGFSVVHKRDLTKDQMLAELSAYTARLTGAGRDTVGFFYYSGYGAANSTYGENYLIPVAAPMTLDSQLVLFGVKTGDVIDALAATPAKTNFVVLDSCRDVPLEFAVRGGENGLRAVKERRGMLVAFATDPGKTATDSGVYAEALAAELERPGEEALQVFKAVRRRVLEATAGKQFPWHADGLLDDFYFKPQEVAVATPVAESLQAAPSPATMNVTGSQRPAAVAPVPIAAAKPAAEAPKPEKPKDDKVAAVEPAQSATKPAVTAGAAEPTETQVYENKAQRLIRTLRGHTGPVRTIDFSPDGEFAVSGGYDANLVQWDLASGTLIRRLKGHTGHVFTAAFSSTGTFILSGGEGLELFLWSARTGELVRTLKGNSFNVFSIAFSSDGNLAVSGGIDRLPVLWDLTRGVGIRTYEGHSDSVNAVALSPNGGYTLTGSSDKTVILWDVATGKALQTFEASLGRVMETAFTSDGMRILSWSDGGFVSWDIATGNQLSIFANPVKFTTAAAISAGGQYLLVGSCSEKSNFHCVKGSIKLFSTTSGRQLHEFIGHRGHVFSLAFSPDGRFALSGGSDNMLKLWDLSEWTHPPASSAAK